MTEDQKPSNLRVLLPPAPAEPEAPAVNKHLVEMLEQALDLAKSGEITSAVIITHTLQRYGHDFAGIDTVPELLGFNTMCDVVKQHLLDIIFQNAES